MAETVAGYCPMGCGQSLFLADGGYITCRKVDCPCPDAVSTILDDPEVNHLVTFDESGFTVLHPLRERLDHELLDCDLHTYCAELPGPPVQLGRYRAIGEGSTWRFTAVTQ